MDLLEGDGELILCRCQSVCCLCSFPSCVVCQDVVVGGGGKMEAANTIVVLPIVSSYVSITIAIQSLSFSFLARGFWLDPNPKGKPASLSIVS